MKIDGTLSPIHTLDFQTLSVTTLIPFTVSVKGATLVRLNAKLLDAQDNYTKQENETTRNGVVSASDSMVSRAAYMNNEPVGRGMFQYKLHLRQENG